MVREIADSSIEPIAEGFHGYNLVKVGMNYYGLKQGHPIDFERIEAGAYSRDICIRDQSLIAVREAIVRLVGDANVAPAAGGGSG
jgi:hypothetical protein